MVFKLLHISLYILQIYFLSTTSITFPELQLAQEGPCQPIEPIKLENLNIDWALRFTAKAGYVPLGSKMHYYTLATTLLQRPPGETDDFDAMCPLVQSGLFESVLQGFGNKVEMICELAGIGNVSCYKKNDPKKTNSTVVVTWADNKNYILTVNCLPGNYRAWNIMSNQKLVDPGAFEEIMKHIESMGFDRTKAQTMNYNGCKEEVKVP